MNQRELSERYYASIPSEDPRFSELRDLLASVKQTGRQSPASRMLGEWALLGFLLTTGQLPIGTPTNTISIAVGDSANPRELLESRRRIEQAAAQLGAFDD